MNISGKKRRELVLNKIITNKIKKIKAKQHETTKPTNKLREKQYA